MVIVFSLKSWFLLIIFTNSHLTLDISEINKVKYLNSSSQLKKFLIKGNNY